jgi:hypothetical protein
MAIKKPTRVPIPIMILKAIGTSRDSTMMMKRRTVMMITIRIEVIGEVSDIFKEMITMTTRGELINIEITITTRMANVTRADQTISIGRIGTMTTISLMKKTQRGSPNAQMTTSSTKSRISTRTKTSLNQEWTSKPPKKNRLTNPMKSITRSNPLKRAFGIAQRPLAMEIGMTLIKN